jgi:hypothetical protein
MKIMVRKQFHIYMFVAVMLASAPLGAAASIIIGGLEDTPGSLGLEKNGDFNDMIFELNGNVTIDSPGGLFNNLTSGVVNQNETVFWDNVSGDGPDMNIGYCLLDESKCLLAGAPLSNLEYLATPSGGGVDDVTFDAAGTVTLELLGGITANANTLGWYDLDAPGVLHQLVGTPADSAGYTVSFTPDGAFALYSSDGWGQVYSSVSAGNIGESADQQHFAFFIEPASDAVPEPSTGVLMGLGVALLGLGLVPRGKR